MVALPPETLWRASYASRDRFRACLGRARKRRYQPKLAGILGVGLFALIYAAEWLGRAWNRLTFRFYGKERIEELYRFMGYVREHRIVAVQKYARSNTLVRTLVAHTALFMLKRAAKNSFRPSSNG